MSYDTIKTCSTVSFVRKKKFYSFYIRIGKPEIKDETNEGKINYLIHKSNNQ